MAIGLGILAALALLEVAARLLINPRQAWQFAATSDWSYDARLGWVNRPNLRRVEDRAGGRGVVFETNADGLQPAAAVRARAAGITRVLLIGDSTIVGRAVHDAERIHHQLARALAERGMPAEVLNAGVEAYSTDQELLLLERLVPAYAPDVVVLAVCNNDFGQNVLGRAYGMNKPILRPRGGRLELVPPEGQVVEPVAGRWLQASALFRALLPYLSQVRAAFASPEERNTLGLVPEIYHDEGARRALHLDVFEALLARIRAVATAEGARFYLYLSPAPEEVWEPFIVETLRNANVARTRHDELFLERTVGAIAARHDVALVPMVGAFRSSRDGPFHLLPSDPHCNARCYRLAAQLLATRIAGDLAGRVPATLRDKPLSDSR